MASQQGWLKGWFMGVRLWWRDMGRLWILFFSFGMLVGVYCVCYFGMKRLGDVHTALGVILGVIAVVITFFLLIYFWWAHNNLFFTFVKEGTAKIVVRGTQFEKVIMRWQGHTLDNSNWNVVPVGVWTKNGKEIPLGFTKRGKTIWKVEERDGELLEIQVVQKNRNPWPRFFR